MHFCRHSSASTQSRKPDTPPPPPFPPPLGAEALVTVRVLEALLLLLKESGWRADTAAFARSVPGTDGVPNRLTVTVASLRRTSALHVMELAATVQEPLLLVAEIPVADPSSCAWNRIDVASNGPRLVTVKVNAVCVPGATDPFGPAPSPAGRRDREFPDAIALHGGNNPVGLFGTDE